MPPRHGIPAVRHPRSGKRSLSRSPRVARDVPPVRLAEAIGTLTPMPSAVRGPGCARPVQALSTRGFRRTREPAWSFRHAGARSKRTRYERLHDRALVRPHEVVVPAGGTRRLRVPAASRQSTCCRLTLPHRRPRTVPAMAATERGARPASGVRPSWDRSGGGREMGTIEPYEAG